MSHCVGEERRSEVGGRNGAREIMTVVQTDAAFDAKGRRATISRSQLPASPNVAGKSVNHGIVLVNLFSIEASRRRFGRGGIQPIGYLQIGRRQRSSLIVISIAGSDSRQNFRPDPSSGCGDSFVVDESISSRVGLGLAVLAVMTPDRDEDALIVEDAGIENLVIGAAVDRICGGVEEEHVGDGSGEFVLGEERVDDVAHWLCIPAKVRGIERK